MPDDSNNSVHGLVMLSILVGVAMVGFFIMMAMDNDLSKNHADRLKDPAYADASPPMQKNYNTDSLTGKKKHVMPPNPAPLRPSYELPKPPQATDATSRPTSQPTSQPDTAPASQP